MAKLSKKVLDEGRQLLPARDLDGFSEWVRRSRVLVNIDLVRRTFATCFRAGDSQKALRIFDATFPELDPVTDRVMLVAKITVGIVVVLGLLGGVVFLFTR
jgi:hypothetical protein